MLTHIKNWAVHEFGTINKMSQRKSFYDETLDRLSFKLLNQNLPPGTNLDGSHFVESGNQCLENDVKMRI